MLEIDSSEEANSMWKQPHTCNLDWKMPEQGLLPVPTSTWQPLLQLPEEAPREGISFVANSVLKGESISSPLYRKEREVLSPLQSDEISKSAFRRVEMPIGSEKASYSLVKCPWPHSGAITKRQWTEFQGELSELCHFVHFIFLLLPGREVS